MKLIDKDALVAEIEKWRDGITKGIFSIPLTGSDRAFATFEYEILGRIKDFLDTLEVKEVDLDREIRRYRMNNPTIGHRAESLYDYMTNIAKHFFELGLKAQKGESV